MPNGNIDINQSNQNIVGQLLKTSMDMIKAEEAEKVIRKLIKTKAEEAAQTPEGMQGLAKSVLQSKVMDEQVQQSQQQPQGNDQQSGGQKSSSGEQKSSGATSNQRSFLNKLLISVGAGMAAAGGQQESAKAILNLVQQQNEFRQKQLQDQEKLKQEQLKSQHLSGAKAEEISLQGHKEMMVEQYKATLKLSEEGMLKPGEFFSKYEPVIKEFQGIVDSYARVQASIEGGSSAAGDLSLLFNYMKMLDPGSVVRESEFANAAATGGLGERFIAAGQKLKVGERLSPAMRSDFVDRAEKLFKAKERQFRQGEGEFRKLAKKNRLDPEKLMRKVSYVPVDPGLLEEAKKRGLLK